MLGKYKQKFFFLSHFRFILWGTFENRISDAAALCCWFLLLFFGYLKLLEHKM